MTLKVLVDWQKTTLGAVPVSPEDIPGLALWWHANDLAGLADAAPVGIWNSRAGTSAATQTTASAQPTKRTVSGLTCIRFDGTDDRLSLGGDALTFSQDVAGATVFIRAKSSSATGTRQIFSAAAGATINSRITVRHNTSDYQIGGRRLDADALDAPIGGAVGTTNIRVHTAVFDYADSAQYGYLDGVQVITDTSFQTNGNTSNTASQTAMIGSQPDGTAQYFNGDLYELLVWPRKLTGDEQTTIETYLLAGGLLADDVTALVLPNHGAVTAEYGRDQSTALAPIVAGRGSIVLNNRDKRFSPRNTSSPLFGYVKPSRPVKITRTIFVGDLDVYEDEYADSYDSGSGLAEYVLFAAHTDDSPINPDVNNKTVTLSLIDSIADFRGQNITTPLYSGIRTGQAINYVLDACGWDPDLRDIDPGATIISWWWEANTDALTALDKLVRSEGPPAMLTIGPDGSIVFKDRHHRLFDARSLTSLQTWVSTQGANPDMQAFVYDDAWRNIINTGIADVDVRQPAPLEAVWTSDTTLSLAAGEQRVIVVSTTDPFYNAQTPVAGTDYTLVSGSIAVTLTRTSGASAGLVITASGAAAIVTDLQLRANSVPVTHSVQVSGSDATSIADYGARSFPSDLPWCNQYDVDAIFQTALALRAQPLPIVEARFQIASVSKAADLLGRDLSDRITIDEDETALNSAEFYVESIRHELAGEHDHRINLGCEAVPATINPSEVFRLDTAGQGADQGKLDGGIANPADILILGSAASGHRLDEGVLAA